MSPRAVRTPTTRPRSSTKSVTSVSSKIRTPRCRAPLAIDIVTSTGLARPSSGVQKPWMTSSVRISGTRSATSRGDSTSLVIPTERMYAVSRRRLSSVRVGRGQLEVAAAAEARRQSGLLLEPRVELGGVARHPQRVLGRAARDHLTRRVPGGARGELLALQQHDVGRTQEREVVGDRRTDHAATDDDVLRPAGQVAGGGRTTRCRPERRRG